MSLQSSSYISMLKKYHSRIGHFLVSIDIYIYIYEDNLRSVDYFSIYIYIYIYVKIPFTNWAFFSIHMALDMSTFQLNLCPEKRIIFVTRHKSGDSYMVFSTHILHDRQLDGSRAISPCTIYSKYHWHESTLLCRVTKTWPFFVLGDTFLNMETRTFLPLTTRIRPRDHFPIYQNYPAQWFETRSVFSFHSTQCRNYIG